MSEERRVTEHDPFFAPFIPREQIAAQRIADQQIGRIASREAAEREAAYLQSLNAPAAQNIPPPSLRQPIVPSGFVEAVDAFDEDVFSRGVGIDRERLLAIGKERFEQLLLLDREARAIQRVIGTNTDLTSWFAVMQAFALKGALSASAVPGLKIKDQFSRRGADRERAAKIERFEQLWKASQEPQSVRAVYRFHDAFASLVFGQSLLERTEDDGRVRSHFFCGGKGKRVRFFRHWLGALQGSHFSVTLVDPISQLIAWLANERTAIPTAEDLAKDFFGVRVPSVHQQRTAEAAFHAFVLGHSASWDTWSFIGNKTRAQPDIHVVEFWRMELVKRYPRIQSFHDELRAAFYKPVSGRDSAHFQLDESAFRQFIDHSMRMLLNRLSALVAIAIEETLPQSVCARFEDFILCQSTSKTKHRATLDAKIFAKLQQAFPNSSFDFRIEGAA
jgi:hypothetical protein